MEIVGQQLGDVGGAGVRVHGEHGEQHQHRTQQRVEEQLERGVDAPGAAPDADNQEHRDQDAFEEDVKHHHVEGAEHADHQRFQDQEGDHVFLHPVGDRLPTGKHADRRQQCGQQHEQHGNAVDAHVVGEP
jgi:hypothetical protein